MLHYHDYSRKFGTVVPPLFNLQLTSTFFTIIIFLDIIQIVDYHGHSSFAKKGINELKIYTLYVCVTKLDNAFSSGDQFLPLFPIWEAIIYLVERRELVVPRVNYKPFLILEYYSFFKKS